MRAHSKRSMWVIFLIIFFGCVIGSCISLFIGYVLPDGVVKDFFLMTQTVGWGESSDNWINLYVIKIKSGIIINLSVVSLLGMSISWYLLRYFR